jgi:choline dehydrogenase-like flavoprotein
MAQFDFDLIVIGSGFGGTMTALTIAHKMTPASLTAEQDKLSNLLKKDPKSEQQATKDQEQLVRKMASDLMSSGKLPRILILERGTWWTTPVPTIQDPLIKTPGFLHDHNQPVQKWAAAENANGLQDLLHRCLKSQNPNGLYDVSRFDSGVSVMRANGVGGGSLVYSNITVRPPDFIFQPWKGFDWKGQQDRYFELAKHAIGYGVIDAWLQDTAGNIPYTKTPTISPKAVNNGLSNISARTARLDPRWEVSKPDNPTNPRLDKRHQLIASAQAESTPENWIDRARVFQDAIRNVNGVGHFGTVDSAINDLTPQRFKDDGTEDAPYDPLIPPNYPPIKEPAPPPFWKRAPINYCERQGRCNIGCLPGARHTLNKQLAAAALGKATDPHPIPQFLNIEIRALTEVDLIAAIPGGGYSITLKDQDNPLTSKRVIVSAGCLGTNEIMLRCQKANTLPLQNVPVGVGFSANGDYIAFLENTPMPVNLTRGPMQTSVAHFFESNDPGVNRDFHIVEDLGIPRALSSAVGNGIPLAIGIMTGNLGGILGAITGLITGAITGQKVDSEKDLAPKDAPKRVLSDDELTMNMMAITASGRDASNGVFSLKGDKLAVKRADGKKFYEDDIYNKIKATLNGPGGLADQLMPASQQQNPDTRGAFVNPFMSDLASTLGFKSVTSTHPLGGCGIGKDAQSGVVDEFGGVFGCPGLYIADASIIPTALGVNPSLTISALSLRIGEKIAADISAE